MNEIYKIPVQLFEDFEKEIGKINSKAKKLNIKEVEYNILEETVFERDEEIEIPCYVVELNQEEELCIDNYEFVAKLEKNINDTFIYYGDESVPKKQKQVRTCQHCNSNRQRKYYYILKNNLTNEYITVGKSCLIDFIGHKSADKIADYFQNFKKICESYNYGSSDCSYEFYPDVYSLDQVLRIAYVSIKDRGYFKSDFEGLATRDHVSYIMSNYSSDKESGRLMNDAIELSLDEINSIKEVINSSPNNNDFMNNLRLLIKDGYVTSKMFGFVCCMPQVAQKIINEAKKDKLDATRFEDSAYIGAVGDKIDIEVIFDKFIPFTSPFGDGYMYFFHDNEYNVIVWRTKTYKDYEESQPLKMRATVKEHTEYRDVKQTFIIRPKFELI